MSEMENTAEHLIVIGRGKLIADCTVSEFIAQNSTETVRVRTPQIDVLAKAVAAGGGAATSNGDGSLLVQGLSPEQVGDIAFASGVRLHELTPARASLEQAFMELTADSIEYHASAGQDGQGQAGPGAAAPVQPGSGAKQQVRAGREA
jgi:ABC-2 type transport system ATP-binding protein